MTRYILDIVWVILSEINRQRRWIVQLMSDLYSGCLNWRPYKFFSTLCIAKGSREAIVYSGQWLSLLLTWSQVWLASSLPMGRMSQPISMMQLLWWRSPSRSCLRKRISQSLREDVWATPISGKQDPSSNGKLGWVCTWRFSITFLIFNSFILTTDQMKCNVKRVALVRNICKSFLQNYRFRRFSMH